MNGVQRGSDSEPDEVRVYQAWQGSNIFLFAGRLIFGPDARSVALSVFLIVAPISVFCVFVARKLMDDYPDHWGISIMVIVVVVTIFDLILLMLTSGRDPGILPRNAYPPEPEGYDGSAEGTPQLRLPRVKEVMVNGISVKIKYCDTCMLYRPPRCSHCSICNNCVERFDHHCPWVGQCIGQRNYRFFVMFIFTTTLLCIYLFGFSWVYIRRIMVSEEISIWRAMIKTPASIVLIVYTFISVWFVGGLTTFHLYLISTNQTTYENFRYRYDSRANPYNKGTIENFKEIYCVPIPPSKNDFRAKVPREPIQPPRRYLPETMDHMMMSRKEEHRDERHDGQLSQLRGNNGLTTKDGGLGPEIRSTVDERDRVGTHSSWGRKSGSWDMSPEVVSLSSRMAESNQNGGTSSIPRSAEPRS